MESSAAFERGSNASGAACADSVWAVWGATGGVVCVQVNAAVISSEAELYA